MIKSKQPNIIFIMSDDHASHAISCYNSRINKTPNIDRIAKEGVRFDNCFCTNSICEPSRAAILTGTYNHVNKVTTIGAHIDNRQENVAKILQRNGYQTAIIGKWHLGQGPDHWPTGFDTWKILIGQGSYFDPIFVEEGIEKQYNGYTTDIITDFSINYLENRRKDSPFMLMVHHKAPHREWLPDEKHMEMYKDDEIPRPFTFDDDYENRSQAAKEAKMRISDHLCYGDLKLIAPEGDKHSPVPNPENLNDFYLIPEETGEKVYFSSHEELKNFKYQRFIKDYLRCVASVDDNIGRLYDYLKKEGILDDTIIIYTSDQGFFLGDHGWYDKRFMYEESLRMPFVMRYPKGIEAGSVEEEIITNVDFAPTLLDYAGIDIPSFMQGYSFRPLLEDNVPDDWQQSMYYRYWMHLSHHYVYAHYGVRTKRYKLIYYYADALGQPCTIDDTKLPEWELFDLEKDPYELKNVYNDPVYRETAQQLKDELHRLQQCIGDEPYEEIESVASYT